MGLAHRLMAYEPSLKAVKGSHESFTSVTFTDIAGLSLPVVAGVQYIIDGHVVFQSDTLTAGLGLAITCPSSTIMVQVGIPVDVNGTAMYHWGNIRGSTGYVQGTAVGGVNANYLATLRGFILPSASGTFQVQANSSTVVGAPTISVRASSNIRLITVG